MVRTASILHCPISRVSLALSGSATQPARRPACPPARLRPVCLSVCVSIGAGGIGKGPRRNGHEKYSVAALALPLPLPWASLFDLTDSKFMNDPSDPRLTRRMGNGMGPSAKIVWRISIDTPWAHYANSPSVLLLPPRGVPPVGQAQGEETGAGRGRGGPHKCAEMR